jgi:carbon monoxide dehydrogenase subunit G
MVFLYAIAALVAAVLLFAATRPSAFRIQRSTSINAPPEAVFAFIDDFHRWRAWSPYESLDPAMQRSYGGAASGKRATYAWEGNSRAGAGNMEIVESLVPSRIALRLEMIKPFAAVNLVEFTLLAQAGGTHLTWAMSGSNGFIARLMGLFFNVDKMVGTQFEHGLARLKALAERPAP